MTPELIITSIVTLIASLIGGGLISVYAQRRKVAADTASTLVDTAGDIVAEYKSQLKECKEEIARLKEELALAENKLADAYIEIKRLQEDNKQLNRRLSKLES